ncbi:MAG: histidine kinase [Ornithinimicrobium sp.]
MHVQNEGGGDARIALVASWAVVFVVVAQGSLSMLSQVTDDLTAVTRSVGILSSLVCAVLFAVVQHRAMQGRSVPHWMPWLVVLLATVGFIVGAWLNAALALGIFSLVLMGWRLVTANLVYGVVLVVFMLSQQVRVIDALFYVLVVAAIGLMLYVLTRLAITVGELARARERLARLRVDDERHRISRDLHDILGRSLVAVSLRIQTAIRLLHQDRERCGEQLGEVARMVAEGQSQLRELTRGATVLGFEDELAAAEELFARLQIRCTAELTIDGGAGKVVDAFGSRVLRECVTNLLKHSRPTWVEINLREESTARVLVIVNDGAFDAEPSGGTGLTDLAERAKNLGVSLEAGRVSGERFRVIARMPLEPLAEPIDGASDPSLLRARS